MKRIFSGGGKKITVSMVTRRGALALAGSEHTTYAHTFFCHLVPESKHAPSFMTHALHQHVKHTGLKLCSVTYSMNCKYCKCK